MAAMLRRDLLRFACALALPGLASGQEASSPTGLPPATPATPADLLGVSGDAYFRDWFNSFYARALLEGASREVLDRALSGLSPDPRVLAKDARQPEFARPVSDYIRSSVTAGRLEQGRALREQVSQFPQIEAQFGCPREILLGVWAMESGFGAIQGDMDVVRSLATLAASGRRRGWAEGELLAAMQIIASGRAPSERLTGSWAGAMGQTQMLPSVYLDDGVDADGDGRVDIWTSAPDALASAAKLLEKAGWRRGEGWAVQVDLAPGFDVSLAESVKDTPDGWAARGAGRTDRRAWPEADRQAPCALVLPCGAQGPAFLTLPNHQVIRSYNNSLAYALAVGLLADGFGGADPLAIAWPHETPLSLDDRLAAQAALQKLGFNPGAIDGVFGTGARAALRAWQKSRGLVADAYLTPALVEVLRQAASGPL